MEMVVVAGQQFELASLAQRFLGQLLDGLFSIILLLLVGLVISSVGLTKSVTGMGVGAILVICAFLYLFFREGLKNGQSYGKRIVKTKVIDSRRGLPCTFMQSYTRNFWFLILGPIDLIFILGAKRQRLGDKLAHTLVVKSNL